MIRIHNVSMQYELGEASVHVLDEVNLAVARGERVAITGPSALLQYRIRLDTENTWWLAIGVALAVSAASLGLGARHLLRRLRVSPAVLLRSGG
ncbi:MAG TPA: hypothetical protein VFZ81_04565 [Burkholderiales bacterium]